MNKHEIKSWFLFVIELKLSSIFFFFFCSSSFSGCCIFVSTIKQKYKNNSLLTRIKQSEASKSIKNWKSKSWNGTHRLHATYNGKKIFYIKFFYIIDFHFVVILFLIYISYIHAIFIHYIHNARLFLNYIVFFIILATNIPIIETKKFNFM